MRRTLPMAVLLMLALAAPALAGSASLTVSARVVHYAALDGATHAGALVVRPADVARGWVVVPSGLSVDVRTNSRSGYRIGFAFAGSFVTGARLDGEGAPGSITPEEPFLVRSSHGPTRESLTFDVRFDLAPGTQPGVYFWPLEVVDVAVAE